MADRYQTTRAVARYVLLPGIIPRVQAVFALHFAFLAAMFAQCFALVKLLPPGHPYLLDQAYGTYGLADVIRAAYARLIFDARHIDQVLIFIAVLVAWVTFWGMFALTLFYAAFTPAIAADMPADVGGLISNIYKFTATPNPRSDVALTLLDRVLGVTGTDGTFFGSEMPKVFPTPAQKGFLALLAFYSSVVMFVAIMIFVYFIFTLVYESATTGTPIGSRFNKFWLPIRLVVGLGLLVPLAPQSLNSAQYVVLYTAKISSAFATNGWLYYLQFIKSTMRDKATPIGMEEYRWDDRGNSVVIADSSPLAAKLKAPDVSDLVRFLHLVAACEYYNEKQLGVNVRGYFVNGPLSKEAYAEPNAPGSNQSYQEALNFFKYQPIRIVFGVQDKAKYPTLPGHVDPICGELVIPVSNINNPDTPKIDNPGAARVQELYYKYVMAQLSKTTRPRQMMDAFAAQILGQVTKIDQGNGCASDRDKDGINNSPNAGANIPELGKCNTLPPITYMRCQVEMSQGAFQGFVNEANRELSDPKNFSIDQTIADRGWVAASVWLHGVADKNGKFVSAVQQVPVAARLPRVMEKSQIAAAATVTNIINTLDATKNRSKKPDMLPNDLDEAKALGFINQFMYRAEADFGYQVTPKGSPGACGINGVPVPERDNSNPIVSLLTALIGGEFLFDFCANSSTHPFTQLATFGRALLEHAGENLFKASAIGGASGVIVLGNKDLSGGLVKFADFFSIVGVTFFTAGFMLFYILPLLPFIYFFFAMLSWVKAIFEALIGAPLWALAHLRLEVGVEKGLPSKASIAGYKLLLEILLRPIATVFGLIAALAIFTGAVYAINDLWLIVVQNMDSDTTGVCVMDGKLSEIARGAIDKFFYTIVYILFVYMIANSSFQLIDKIPNSFMKWFGGAGKSFSAEAHKRDAASGNFISNAFIAVGEPVKGMAKEIDETSYKISHFAASQANSDGQITRAVQDMFGPDREARVDHSLARMAELSHRQKQNAAAAVAEMQQIQQAVENGLLSPEEAQSRVADLTRKRDQMELEAQANDPEMLMDMLVNGPDKAKMLPSAKTMLSTKQNLEILRKDADLIRDTLMDGGEIGGKKSKPPSDDAVVKMLQAKAKAAKENAGKKPSGGDE